MVIDKGERNKRQALGFMRSHMYVQRNEVKEFATISWKLLSETNKIVPIIILQIALCEMPQWANQTHKLSTSIFRLCQ